MTLPRAQHPTPTSSALVTSSPKSLSHLPSAHLANPLSLQETFPDPGLSSSPSALSFFQKCLCHSTSPVSPGVIIGCPGHRSHQGFPGTFPRELWSPGLPVRSQLPQAMSGWSSSHTPSRWVCRQTAPSSRLLCPCCLNVVPKHATFSSSLPVFPPPQKYKRVIIWSPGWNVQAGDRRCEDAQLDSCLKSPNRFLHIRINCSCSRKCPLLP